MHVDGAVIDRSVEEGCREVALALLRECDDAARRLAGEDDDEALHDFRVGLRRLRTTLRAFAPWLEGSVGRRDVKRLRKLAKSSNAARDAEVHLAFLDDQASHGGALRRAGIEFLRDRIEAHRRDGMGVDRLLAKYRRSSSKLARRLPRYEVRLDDAPSTATFAAALAGVVCEQLATVRARADAIAGADDEERIHKTRIAVKRLRYLLEPLRRDPHADARAAVRALKRLQDVLGDLHDVHTLAHEVESALLEATAEQSRRLFAAAYGRAGGAATRDALRGGPRAGVLALARAVRDRRDALFAELEHTWRAGGLDALATEVARVTSALELRAGGKVELPQRYVLSALPPRAATIAPVEIAVGWLPGARVRERLRVVRAVDGERYWRDLEQGAGSHRVHVEEETSRELFTALWSLTEGRETRRRREVSDGDVRWRIDELPERNLLLAEALSPHAAQAHVPAWLRPFIVAAPTKAGRTTEADDAAAPAGGGDARSDRSGDGAPSPDGEPAVH